MATRTTVLKRTIEGLYQPHRKHEILFQSNFQQDWIHPDLLEVVEKCQSILPKLSTTDLDHTNESNQKPVDLLLATNHSSIPLRVEVPGVYSFKAFTNDFLQLLREELDNFYQASEKYKIPIRRPNSMNNYGIVVNEIGLRPLITSFQQTYLWPLARILFPTEATPKFDDHHSFLVRYQANEDLGLDMHTDDSDVTFNVCLGDPGFTGATLTFCGMFGAPHHRHVTHVYHHEIGRAILHLGSQRHGADAIASGCRRNLIIWSHNWTWRASDDYKSIRTFYQPEQGPPDEVCLSYTHDVDYIAYKGLPERAKKLQLTPWCPPPGMEYDGFDEAMNSSLQRKKKKKKQSPIQGDDDFDQKGEL